MLLNEKQLKILQTIEAGNTTGEAIAAAMGASTQMLKYYLDKLAEDGYIKTARVYDNALQDFLVVRAYLTPAGHAELAQLGNSTLPLISVDGRSLPQQSAPQPTALDHPPVPPANLPYPSSVSSPTAAVDKPPVPRADIAYPTESMPVPAAVQKPPVPRADQPYPTELNQPLDVQDIGEVIKLIDSFEQVLSILTKENRDLATVYFADLQAEVKVPYRRNMKRINAYLKAFLQVVRSRSGTAIDEVRQAAQVVITKLNLPPDEVI